MFSISHFFIMMFPEMLNETEDFKILKDKFFSVTNSHKKIVAKFDETRKVEFYINLYNFFKNFFMLWYLKQAEG